MHFKLHNRPLLRSVTASAVLLVAASACSRSDKVSSGGNTDTTQTGLVARADTQSVATQSTAASRPSSADTIAQISESPATKPSHPTKSSHPTGRARPSESQRKDTGVSGYQAMGRDSSADTTSESQDTVAVGDSAHIGKTGNRLEPTQSAEQAHADTLSNQSDSVRIRPPEDSSETVGVTTTDSAAAAVSERDTASATDSSVVSTEMARDTTTALGQADTTAPSDSSARVTADTSAVQAQVDTTQETEMAQQAPVDTAAIQARVDTTQAQADTSSVAVADSSQVKAQQPNEDVESDQAAVGAAGVTSANIATGAEAVAQLTRQGEQCIVVEADKDARWDLALSPAPMNPCGTGTMTLPRVQVEK